MTGNPHTYLRDLLAVGDTLVEEPTSSMPVLAERLPWLADHIRADAGAGRLEGWARSTVTDRTTAHRVIPTQIFHELQSLAGIAALWPVGNAGLLHAYAYLLSAAPTSHGPKRDRWLTPQLAEALDLDADAFSPWGHMTTPLERISAVARPILLCPGDDAGLRFWGEESTNDVTTRTVVVCAQSSDTAVLVYGMDEGDGMRLVTIFPIVGFGTAGRTAGRTAGHTSVRGGERGEGWVAQWMSKPPRLRYNAVASALPAGAPLADRRIVRGLTR